MLQITVETDCNPICSTMGIDPDNEFHIPHTSLPQNAKEVIIHLSFLDTQAGEEGYYVIPNAKVCFLTNFTQRVNQNYICSECIMPMLGAKLKDKGYLLTVEGMPYNFSIQINIHDNKYHIALLYNLSAIDLYEDIRIRVTALAGSDANYSGIARAYRKMMVRKLNLVPLAVRVQSNPVLAYGATDMPIIRIRMAWKPVPTPVLEQTLQTEPPLHVACTFDQVEKLMEEMKLQGIEKAEICLVGWNVKGHDGRWPQMFPVEEKLGGENGLRKVIAHARKIGYRVTCHTNSSDAYHIADSWDENEIIKTKSGALSVNENTWSGGRMYNLCPKVACEKYLHKNLPKIKALGFEGFHYIDVLTIVPPRTCYNAKHPLTAEQSVQYLNKILKQTQQAIGGIASEGGYDFAAANLDFSLYIAFNLLTDTPAIADEMIPLWQLVYHGYILSNPSAETINFTIKKPENRLRFYEFGGLPVIYFYSRFVGGNGRNNWMGDQDMFCATEEQRKESVRQIKRMLRDYHPYAERRLAFMDEHKKVAEGVFETVYSDGYHSVVNYNNTDYIYGDKTVPGKNVIQFFAGK